MLNTRYNISKINHEKCTGCAVCRAVCSLEAIKMKTDKDGFVYPLVDEDKCVQCGLCFKLCHTQCNNLKWNTDICFAGYYADDKLLSTSSSGGAATAISLYTINRGGIVYGVDFESDYKSAKYFSASTADELIRFKTSKYIQSDPPNYLEIKNRLDNKEFVTFIGLPCQCDALYVYLGKEYDNLLLISLICHGPTSSLILEKYVDEIESKYGKISNLKLRYKKNGYTRPSRIYFTTENKKYVVPFICSSFGMSFELLNRLSCSNCHSKYPNGYADIILGDFWGGKDKNSKQSEKGESLIILRNPDKQSIIDELVSQNFVLEEASFDDLDKKNPALVKSRKIRNNRNRFVEDLQKMSLCEAINSNVSKKERLFNYIYYILRSIIPQRIWNLIK